MTSTSAAQPSRIVIVGASLAGGSAAVALREQGYAGELTLIGEEEHRPYERPPLSKALMQGEVDEPDWVADEAFWTDKTRCWSAPWRPGSTGIARSSWPAAMIIRTTS